MLTALAGNWGLLLLRVVIATLFGVAALTWPGLRATGLALLFGAYALSDGFLALIVAARVKGRPGFGSLLFEAIVRMAVGVGALVSPAATALALGYVFAVWALLSGTAAIAAHVALKRDMAGEWPLPFAGSLSLLCGMLLLVGVGAPDLKWVVGPYAILFAMTLLALTLRLRQLAAEIAAIPTR
jgi:uncharacterized membrane protein HdeD (DUF308 family)